MIDRSVNRCALYFDNHHFSNSYEVTFYKILTVDNSLCCSQYLAEELRQNILQGASIKKLRNTAGTPISGIDRRIDRQAHAVSTVINYIFFNPTWNGISCKTNRSAQFKRMFPSYIMVIPWAFQKVGVQKSLLVMQNLHQEMLWCITYTKLQNVISISIPPAVSNLSVVFTIMHQMIKVFN